MEAKHNKKQILMKGIGLHLLVYSLIALFLSLLGVASLVVFLVVMVLLWGLLVLSYAYYYEK
jgi:hypothetical protein